MKININEQQWQQIGKKAGWMKIASSKEEAELAGYIVHRSFCDGVYLEVTTPTNDEGVLVQQAPNIWHFFFSNFEGSASGQTPKTAIEGNLSDAIGTDDELKEYERLLINAPEVLLQSCDGLYRTSSGVFNEAYNEGRVDQQGNEI